MDRKLRRPSEAEERKINRGIKNDPETFEASDEEFAETKAASEVSPLRCVPRGHQASAGQRCPSRQGQRGR